MALGSHAQQHLEQLDNGGAIAVVARLFDLGQRLRVAGEATLHRRHHVGSPFRALKTLGQRAQIGEPLQRGRGMDRDVADRFVLDDPVARHVAALRFLLAPGRDLHQHRQLARLAHPGLQPLPGPFRVEIIGFGRGQDLHFLADPVAAAALLQVGIKRREHVAQMGDVGHRVMQLLLGERPPRPVGEAVGLVGTMPGDALDQLVVGDRVAVTQHHRGHLGVENRMRQDAGAVPDDFDVLPGGMKHLEHLVIGHQLEKRLEVDARRQRIDHHRLIGAGHLHHAQQRVIGGLPQEFGIDRDDRKRGEAGAGGGELLGGGDEIHGLSITLGRRRSAESAVMSSHFRE